jgi:hypothetical protein
MIGNTIWWPLSTTRPARSTRALWSRRRHGIELSRALAEVIDRHGLFCELSTDRGSHYFHMPKAGEAVSKTVQTQVGRALAQLGVRHIAASSPARGRSERAFRTLQDRAEGAGPGRDHDDRGGQSLARRDLLAGPQCRLRGGPGRGLQRFRRRPHRPRARHPVHPGGCAGWATTTPSNGAA